MSDCKLCGRNDCEHALREELAQEIERTKRTAELSEKWRLRYEDINRKLKAQTRQHTAPFYFTLRAEDDAGDVIEFTNSVDSDLDDDVQCTITTKDDGSECNVLLRRDEWIVFLESVLANLKNARFGTDE